jgi:hypothetical protein
MESLKALLRNCSCGQRHRERTSSLGKFVLHDHRHMLGFPNSGSGVKTRRTLFAKNSKS